MSNKTLTMTDKLYEYLIRHSLREPELLQRLREETAKDPLANPVDGHRHTIGKAVSGKGIRPLRKKQELLTLTRSCRDEAVAVPDGSEAPLGRAARWPSSAGV